MFEPLLVMAAALAIDAALGDPGNRYHPTAWMGGMIAAITVRARNIPGRFGGVAVVVPAAATVAASVTIILYLFDAGASVLPEYLQVAASVLFGGLLLKTTLAVRGMKRHAEAVVASLDRDDIGAARVGLSAIVKRDTRNLNKRHIISGVLESISENTVDGITGPLFYYAIFGLPGAFVYRVINTADSMIGYRTRMFRDVGWFAARCDTILNYAPSRLTGLVMVVSAAMLRYDWRGSYSTMMRDGAKTASSNAGYPMAALAGALGTQFEKIGHYSLGSGGTHLTREHVQAAVSIMRLTSVLFVIVVSAPITTALFLAGWWIHA